MFVQPDCSDRPLFGAASFPLTALIGLSAARSSTRLAILPPYLRQTRAVEDMIPWLYLKGVSTGDFSEALGALLDPEAKGVVVR